MLGDKGGGRVGEWAGEVFCPKSYPQSHPFQELSAYLSELSMNRSFGNRNRGQAEERERMKVDINSSLAGFQL